MPIPDDILARARKGDARAAEAVVAASYPSVSRIARALVGREAAAARVMRSVMQQSLRVMPKWRESLAPENWYYHHTVITARAAVERTALPGPTEDPLVVNAPPAAAGDVRYVAFVRALRGLPEQQAEAYLLHHGERLNDRLLGVAMDCSASAAANHLRAAEQTLAAVSGGGGTADDLAAALTRAYTALAPPEPAVRAAVRGAVASALWPRRIKRLVRAVVLLALLTALAYAAWRWRDQLLPFIDRLREKAQGS